jgi:hypothetical protein
MNNVAKDPQYTSVKEELAAILERELVNQEDPRALGNGHIFDTYYYMGFDAIKKLYGERFKVPDHLKKYEFTSGGKVD